MKINTIINRYLFRELLPPFFINLVFLTFVFLMTQILEVTSMVVNYRVSIVAVGLMLFYSMPSFLTYTIPMSVMLSVLLNFLRMSGDNEITAVKAGGANVYALLPPVLLFCTLGALFTLSMTVTGSPWGKLALQKLEKQVMESNLEAGLKKRTFNADFSGVMLYVNDIDMSDKELKDIFVEDSREGEMVSSILAPRGELLNGKERFSYVLRLYNGLVNQVTLSSGSVNTTRFSTYDIHLDLKRMVAGKKGVRKHRDEMSVPELLAYTKDTARSPEQVNSAWMELHEKFSIPFACIALGILAVPVGMRSASSRRQGSGIGIGLGFFLLYYLLLAAGWSLGESGGYPPAVGMWMPDLVMGGIGCFLLVQTARETSFTFAGALGGLWARISLLVTPKRG